MGPARPKHNRHGVSLKHTSGNITQNPKDFFFQNPFKFCTLMRNEWKSRKSTSENLHPVTDCVNCMNFSCNFLFWKFFCLCEELTKLRFYEFGSMYRVKMPIGKSGSCLHTTLEQQMMCFSQSLRGTAAAITVHTCRAEPQCVDLKLIL